MDGDDRFDLLSECNANVSSPEDGDVLTYSVSVMLMLAPLRTVMIVLTYSVSVMLTLAPLRTVMF